MNNCKLLVSIIFFFILFSCNKNSENSKNTEGVTVQEFDNFIADEIVEEIDTTIDERNPPYEIEADNKIDVVIAVAGTVSDFIAPENTCTGFRYGSYFLPRKENKVLLSYANDNIKSITASDGVIKNLRKDLRNNKAFYFTLDSMTKNLELINLTFNLNTNSVQKGIRFLEYKDDTLFYGTSSWGRMVERKALRLPENRVTQIQNITASYIPQKGDILYFLNREGVITSNVTKNKEGKWKFKEAEWNSKCTGRKMTKSVLVADITKIISANKLDTATRFAR
jgi:hypothetical protein